MSDPVPLTRNVTWGTKVLRFIPVRFTWWIGKVMGWAGLPGFVRDCEYQCGISGQFIRVQVSPLFTVVSVNGLDVYFYRMTGGIDGTGSGSPQIIEHFQAKGEPHAD